MMFLSVIRSTTYTWRRVTSELTVIEAFPWHTGVVLNLPRFLGNVGDDNLMVRQTWSIRVCPTHLKTRAFFPLSTDVRQLSSSQWVLVAIPKTTTFNPCLESKSPLSIIRHKQCVLHRTVWWNLWALCVQVSCFRCLRGIVWLMWSRLWKGCVLAQRLFWDHQHQQVPSQYVKFLELIHLFSILNLIRSHIASTSMDWWIG